MKVISVSNQKGGVAKTTTVINLSAALTILGRRVLTIDMDPQAHLTSGLNKKRSFEKSIYDILVAEYPLRNAILKTEWNNLDLIPSSIALANAEIELSQMVGRETVLKSAIEEANIENDYDFVFIDTGPNLGNLTLNAFAAANSLIVPIEPEMFALEGVEHLVKIIGLVRKKINKNLEIEGVLLTKVNPRTNIAKEFTQAINEIFKDKMFNTIINQNVKIAEAQSSRQPVVFYDKEAKGSLQYIELAKELIAR